MVWGNHTFFECAELQIGKGCEQQQLLNILKMTETWDQNGCLCVMPSTAVLYKYRHLSWESGFSTTEIPPYNKYGYRKTWLVVINGNAIADWLMKRTDWVVCPPPSLLLEWYLSTAQGVWTLPRVLSMHTFITISPFTLHSHPTAWEHIHPWREKTRRDKKIREKRGKEERRKEKQRGEKDGK